MSKLKTFGILFTILTLAFLDAQGVSLSQLQLEMVGYIPDTQKTPLFISTGIVSGRFVPFPGLRLNAGATLLIPDTAGFFNPDPDSGEPGLILFNGFSAMMPSFLGSPLDFTIFTGYLDDPGSGSLLREYLKISIPSPEFHEKTAGRAFSPDTGIRGTGFSFAAVPGNVNYILAFYGYWNARFDDGAVITCDARFAGTNSLVQYNIFSGFSVEPASSKTSIRGGITALLGAGSSNELFIELGAKSFVPGSSRSERNLYALFEPRIHGKTTDFALSFFVSPVFPDNIPGYIPNDAQSTYLGTNILFGFGDLRFDHKRGGISFLGSINPEDSGVITPFSFAVSPFYSMMVSDFVFEIVTTIKPLLLDTPLSMGEVHISLKAVY